MPNYEVVPIVCKPGIVSAGDNIQPSENEGVTGYWTAGNKMRFVAGWPQSLQGTSAETLTVTDRDASLIYGTARTFKYINLGGTDWYIIGTTLGLYAYDGSAAWNIAPLQTATTAIANSLATFFTTLANNPIATTSGQSTIVVTHASHGLRTGDSVTLAGSAAVNNITAGQINTTFTITVLTSSTYRVTTAGTANATGSGGGAAVTSGTGRITVTHAAHGFEVGYRVKLNSAADTGGIVAANINIEHVIRAKDTNTYDIYCSTNATSSVSAAGGAGTTEQAQISMADGASYPTIWSLAHFEGELICCPGDARGIYRWAGATATAPTLVSGAPASANWIFVINNKLVALGAYSAIASNQKDNRIRGSKSSDITDWDSTVSGTDAYEDIKAEAERFLCSVVVGDRAYLFTETQVFALDDIGGDDVYRFSLITTVTGTVAANAVYEVDGLVYFMGLGNIYRINGGQVEPLLNEEDLNAYALFVVESAINTRKHFAYFVRKWNELYFHNPTDGKYISFSPRQDWWTFQGTMSRTAMMSNNPSHLIGITSGGTIYSHGDSGPSNYNTWDGSDISGTVTTNWRSLDGGKTRALIHGVELAGMFDTGLTIAVQYKDDFMSDSNGIWETKTNSGIDDEQLTAYRVFFGPISARYWRYKFTMPAASYSMRISGFKEYITKGSRW